ncbi:hypothetical protein [Janibacter corallicola]|uniref:hypothetical protein n=1 Tax=Janibacter corallicola TaxID=415212 RepID=UPI000832EA51|nr:hypothetical protein [Janibacter corallicola]
MAVTSFRASDLSRDSAKVFRTAERGPVEVTRRDGEPLVLTRKSEYDDHYAALNAAADLIAASLEPSDSPLERRLQARMPWMRFLSEEDRAHFSHDIIDVARGCAAVHDFGPFLQELTEWHSTAAAVAAGYTAPDDLDWFDEPVPAADPRTA